MEIGINRERQPGMAGFIRGFSLMQIIGLDPSFRWDDSGVAAVIIKSPVATLREVGRMIITRARQTSSSAEKRR